MFKSNITRAVVAATIFGTFLAVSPAAPAVAGDLGSPITVTFADLDLASAKDAQVLYQRIRLAAESVCAPLDHGDVLSKQHTQTCVSNSTAHAVTTIDSPALRAVYEARNGNLVPSTTTAAR